MKQSFPHGLKISVIRQNSGGNSGGARHLKC
jgi:hypothetical protein